MIDARVRGLDWRGCDGQPMGLTELLIAIEETAASGHPSDGLDGRIA
jgi:hypothetical protein